MRCNPIISNLFHSPTHKRFNDISRMMCLINVMYVRNWIFNKHLDSRKLDILIEELKSKINVLDKTETITNHSEEETKEAKSLIIHFLLLSLLSHRVVERIEERNKILQEILDYDKWNKLETVNRSSKLEMACAMLMLGYSSSSKAVLMYISDNDKISVCGCHTEVLEFTVIELHRAFERIEHISNTPTKTLLKELFQPCVVFLPTEQLITPIAIN